MSDIRQELVTAGDALAGAARQASYVAIGFGILAFQKAQVRRRELIATPRDGATGVLAKVSPSAGRDEMARRAKDFDATVAQVIKAVDATVEPVIDRLPEPVRVIVEHAREARDDLRKRVFGPPPC